MKTSMLHIIGCLSMVLLVGCSSPDEKANKLFVEASQLVKSAQEVEKTSYSSALKLYNEVAAKVEEIISKYPSSQIAVKLCQGEAKIGNHTVDQFSEAVRYTKIKSEAEGNPFNCAILIFDVTKPIKNANLKAWALADIAQKYAHSGQKDKSVKLFSQALAAAYTVENDEAKAVSLYNIADKLAENGHYDKAVQVAKTIQDGNLKAYLLAKITAQQYAEAGQYDKAVQVVTTIRDSWRKAHLLALIANRYVEDGQYEKAFQLIKRIEEDYFNTKALAHIATKYVEDGQYEKANQVELQIKKAKYQPSKAEALADIAVKYFHGGQRDKALNLLFQARQVAQTIEDSQSKAITLGDIAVIWAQTGEKERTSEFFSQALQIAGTIKGADGGLRNTALCQIAEDYAEVGQYNEALSVADIMTNGGMRDHALGRIAKKYAEDGRYEKALQILTKIEDGHVKGMSIAALLAAVAVAYEKAGKKLDDNSRMVLHEIIRDLG